MSSKISEELLSEEAYQKAYHAAVSILQDLPARLSYHTRTHTMDVVSAAARIGAEEGLSQQDQWRLLTAALFHDAGFIKGYQDHEEYSCEVASEVLPGAGYPPAIIENICQLIRATKLPQAPTSLSEQIICDADLYYLGSPTFFKQSEQLYQEFLAEGVVADRSEWEQRQLAFLENHQYFTHTANRERAKQKAVYLKQVRTQWKNSRRKTYFSRSSMTSLHDMFFMAIGVFISGFALKSLLVPNHFFDGGITGISLLLHELFHWNLATVIILANLPLIAMGYFSVSKSFALKTLSCVILLSVCLWLIPYPPIITADRILVAIFGGFFIGTGIGMCMRAGCALDGVEVLALKAFKKTPFTVTELILGINIFIFGIAAIEVGIMTALYSILTYFTASKTIDYVVEGIEAYTGVTIISTESDLLKHRLVNELGRGITVYKGERGFLPGKFETSADCDIIFTVVTRLEIRRLQAVVQETDPKAFVFASTIREASGGILRRRSGSH